MKGRGVEEKGIRQGAACAKVLWQAAVRFAEEQGKAGRAGEWRVPGTAGEARLQRALEATWGVLGGVPEHWEAVEGLSREGHHKGPRMRLPGASLSSIRSA